MFCLLLQHVGDSLGLWGSRAWPWFWLLIPLKGLPTSSQAAWRKERMSLTVFPAPQCNQQLQAQGHHRTVHQPWLIYPWACILKNDPRWSRLQRHIDQEGKMASSQMQTVGGQGQSLMARTLSEAKNWASRNELQLCRTSILYREMREVKLGKYFSLTAKQILETRGFLSCWVLLVSQLGLLGKFWANEKPCLKNKKEASI